MIVKCIDGSGVRNLLLRAEYAIEKAIPLINDSKRTGGYFCIASLNFLRIMAVQVIGDVVDDGEAAKYFKLCQEKAVRLAVNTNHVSSWQSRDEKKEMYGGAIRTNDLILSFSGFSELWDEACMIEVACRNEIQFSFANYLKIIRASKNEFVTETFGNFYARGRK